MKFVNKLFLVILGFSIFFVACESDTTNVDHKSSFQSILESVPSMEAVDGIPYYESLDAFLATHSTLEQAHDAYFENISKEYEHLTSEEINELFEDGILDDFAVFNRFKGQSLKVTLLDVDEKILTEWLDQPNLDWDTYPEDELTESLDDIMKTMVNRKGEANIGGEVINIKEQTQFTDEKTGWCTPVGTNSEFHLSANGNNRIRTTGTLSRVGLGGGLVGVSFISGRVESYRRRNGNWRKFRSFLRVNSGCTVRRSPLAECQVLGGISTGWKGKSNARSITVTKFGTNVQIWHKRTRAAGPDGLAEGSSTEVPTGNTPF